MASSVHSASGKKRCEYLCHHKIIFLLASHSFCEPNVTVSWISNLPMCVLLIRWWVSIKALIKNIQKGKGNKLKFSNFWLKRRRWKMRGSWMRKKTSTISYFPGFFFWFSGNWMRICDSKRNGREKLITFFKKSDKNNISQSSRKCKSATKKIWVSEISELLVTDFWRFFVGGKSWLMTLRK